MSQAINRRRVLGVVAAIPAAAAVTAIPVAGLAKAPQEPSELAALIGCYFAEVEAFNNSPELCDDNFFHADQPFDATLMRIVGVPVRTSEDAVAAIDWIIHDGDGCMIELGGDHSPYAQVAGWLVESLRAYLVKQVAV